MTLFSDDGELHVPAQAREVYDVSGAGDTVVAVLAAMLAAGRPVAGGGAAGQPGGRHRRRQAGHCGGLAGGAVRVSLARVARGVTAIALGCACAGGVLALDANTATRAELESIRGVGPALSARIVEARGARPFADLDDLKRVRGIGDANLRRMREAGLTVGPAARVQTFIGQPASPRPQQNAAPAPAARRASRRAGNRAAPPLGPGPPASSPSDVRARFPGPHRRPAATGTSVLAAGAPASPDRHPAAAVADAVGAVGRLARRARPRTCCSPSSLGTRADALGGVRDQRLGRPRLRPARRAHPRPAADRGR